MTGPLAGGINAVMTANTGFAADGAMVEHNLPGCGFMANIAFAASVNVVWPLAGGDAAVMTTGANTNHLAVIHSIKGQPGIHIVASLAFTGRRYVIKRFTACLHAIMTTKTALPCDQGMVKTGDKPTGGDMAIVTGQVGRWMIDARLPSGDNAVMARLAYAEHLIVIDMIDRFKTIGVMTSFANLARGYMGRRFTATITAVMTVHAYRAGTNLTMIHLL